jgi:hypothetical protein
MVGLLLLNRCEVLNGYLELSSRVPILGGSRLAIIGGLLSKTVVSVSGVKLVGGFRTVLSLSLVNVGLSVVVNISGLGFKSIGVV